MSTDGHELREVSYGGVTIRDGEHLLVITPRGKSRELLALPKGGPDPGETHAETALREVWEETGVTAEAFEELGQVDYWYRRGGHKVHKTVHFFLCRHLEGEPTPDGVEVSQAKWIPLEDAPKVLAYKGERQMVERALSKLRSER
jgi:8-oxo-dGTP pyrophosphatase MutT (NUDIX family)